MTPENDPLISGLGLLVLDVQDSFLKSFPDPVSFLHRVKFSVEVARQFRIPTLFTEQRPDILGNTIEDLSNLNPDSTQISKTGFSAFTEAGVGEWITRHQLHHLLMAGLETPICVYQTVLDALNESLDVTLLSDCVGGRRPEDAVAIMASLRGQGVHILPSETVFYSILRDSKHPAFREFTQMVKKYSAK